VLAADSRRELAQIWKRSSVPRELVPDIATSLRSDATQAGAGKRGSSGRRAFAVCLAGQPYPQESAVAWPKWIRC
jgi:hypothetical protein